MPAIAQSVVTDRALEREHPDFDALVEDHKRGVYYLALDLTGNHADAEDLSQDVFLKAFRGMRGFRGESSPYTWLRRITVNTFLNGRRRRRLSLVTLGEGAEDPPDPSGREPESGIEAARVRREIDAALEALSNGERTAFVLRHYHDMSIAEVARAMDVADGTVKSFLFRGTQKMKDRLAHLRTEIHP